MNKAKRVLMSIIVFTSVFCLSAIVNITDPFNAKMSTESGDSDTTFVESVSLGKNTEEIKSETSIDTSNSVLPLEDAPAYALEDTPTSQANIYSDAEDKISVKDNSSPSKASKVTPDDVNEASEVSQEGTDESEETGDLSEDEQAETTLMAVSQVSLETAPEESEENTLTEDAIVEDVLYANIGISIANDFVNLREEPSTDSTILGKLYKNSAAEILETQGEWYYVESGSVKGYIKCEFIKTGIPDDELIEKYGELTMIVAVDGLNVRENPDMESKKLTVIYQNETYPVIEVTDDWIKIDISDDKVAGYVKSEFAELTVDFPDAVSKEEEEELLRIQAEERAKKETEIKQQDSVNYTAEELKLLACLVHSEAGTQSYEGKLAVANVVLNRVKCSKYPDAMKAVIYQSGQFSVARSGSLDKQLSNYDNYSSNSQLLSIKAAKAALEGSNNIGTRLYFHSYNAAVKKGYDTKSTSVKIGDHLFW